jgi:hypothetical protein
MKKCLIRLGPAVTPKTLDDVGPERDVYDRLELCTRSQVTEQGHLVLLPAAPVCIDHDDDQEVGRIIRLHTFDDALGRWWFARCEISQPPEWLRRGTKASICFSALQRGEAAGRGVVRHALVREVSILSPGVIPAEPFAEVAVLEDAPTPARPLTRHERDIDRLRGLIVLGWDPEQAIRRLQRSQHASQLANRAVF